MNQKIQETPVSQDEVEKQEESFLRSGDQNQCFAGNLILIFDPIFIEEDWITYDSWSKCDDIIKPLYKAIIKAIALYELKKSTLNNNVFKAQIVVSAKPNMKFSGNCVIIATVTLKNE